ncbi:MAG: 3-alpha,7-alpha,12-alpha-trihydroxy-5-beta-cholest-24-enoyl-CoA hydratase [Chloroflexota bacterium]|nr:MAG: 3-alpha,7-alpha,12-alpha-trihydroxy-5-beta-cholest-24-enoyl-CoA hydratase [Chloroflexota bacterium]
MVLDVSVVGKHLGTFIKEYTWKDMILYALGVGSGFDELEYCYEEGLKVLPSFGVAVLCPELTDHVNASAGVNLAGTVHGEHELILHRPIPPAGGTWRTEAKIAHMYDKGSDKGAVVITTADTYDANGQKLFTNILTNFCRLDGGFGGENAPSEPAERPVGPPDYEEMDRPSRNQPLLYRLSGDYFPLHVHPERARECGFEGPIVHGLCTYGYTCRAIVKRLIPGEPERLTRLRARFTRSLYPDTPIKTQIWEAGEGKALFRAFNVNNGDVVVDRGVAEWKC